MTTVRVVPGTLRGTARAPPSKSYTHRLVLAAHLSGRVGRIRRPLEADDTQRTADAVRALGSRVSTGARTWTVTPGPGEEEPSTPVVDCGQSGTTLRLLAPAAGLQARAIRFVGGGRLPLRPMAPLFETLRELGASITRPANRAALPFEIRGPLHGGRVDLPVTESSQYTSALLMSLPCVTPDSHVRTIGQPVSEPYVRATLEVLRRQGIVIRRHRRGFRIPGGQAYRVVDAEVPGDASSAAYLWAGAAITGGRVTVTGVPPRWPQADLAVLGLLRRYGASVARHGPAVTVEGDRRRPFRIDLNDAPDLYPLAGALAAAAPGRSELVGAAHVVAKESDRRRATIDLVRALGGRTAATPDGLAIEGTDRPRALRLRELSDHRLVMSAAVAALAADRPSTLADAASVGKSYPGFFGAIARLGAEVGRA
jgi:3-phosphoshikimate 1-carboxyvinyltransferase